MKILTKNISQFTNTDIYVQNKSQKKCLIGAQNVNLFLTKMFLSNIL